MKDFEAITIHGTRNLLTVALEAPLVEAFIFTSSATMAAGPEHIDLDENTRLADMSSGSHVYATTKTRADKMVLATNRPSLVTGAGSLSTACTRLPIVYGERDLLAVPATLAVLRRVKPTSKWATV